MPTAGFESKIPASERPLGSADTPLTNFNYVSVRNQMFVSNIIFFWDTSVPRVKTVIPNMGSNSRINSYSFTDEKNIFAHGLYSDTLKLMFCIYESYKKPDSKLWPTYKKNTNVTSLM
jgi:hypothetical protein